MSMEAFDSWMNSVSTAGWCLYVKRLSANDTLANDSHQAGPYIPKGVFFTIFPELKTSAARNPDARLKCVVVSHSQPEREVRAVWYNQKTRDECRTTNWGGSASPLLDPDSTGSVCVFAFNCIEGKNSEYCSVWLCNLMEEDYLIDRVGPVDPGKPLLILNGHNVDAAPESVKLADCSLSEEQMPALWRNAFPSASEIVNRTLQLRPLVGRTPDDRLLMRRECEYQMFRSVEHMLVMPVIKQGFNSIDEFIEFSNSVNNRRKSRSGRSLELQVRGIFDEEKVSYAHGEVSEGNKRPDFLFPSVDAYKSNSKPLHMLAAKTTCKDRWRQILNEADLIPEKNLITLQEGLSENQFAEMKRYGVKLVVPSGLHKSYPKSIRPELLDFKSFISLVRNR